MEKDITITYETLFELLRLEKNRVELQKLDSSFFADAADYIKEKEDLLKQPKDDPFAKVELERAEKQIVNIRNILRELYERRERKTIEMALDASRTASALIDTSALLHEEKQLYESIRNTLSKFREDILFHIQQANAPKIKGEEQKPNVEKEAPSQDVEIPKPFTAVTFTHPVPTFVGPDLQEYGPFVQNDKAELPSDIAEILVNKGRAEEN